MPWPRLFAELHYQAEQDAGQQWHVFSSADQTDILKQAQTGQSSPSRWLL
jgi:hypothetical protein